MAQKKSDSNTIHACQGHIIRLANTSISDPDKNLPHLWLKVYTCYHISPT